MSIRNVKEKDVTLNFQLIRQAKQYLFWKPHDCFSIPEWKLKLRTATAL